MSSARISFLLVAAAALPWTAEQRVFAQEPWVTPEAATTETAAPAAVPAAPVSDAERLQALEKRVAEQKKTIEAMRAEHAGAEIPEAAEVDPPKLRIYGFVDTGAQWLGVAEGPNKAFIASAPAFVMGNIHLYFDANPSPSWRALVEMRYGLAPNGTYNASGLTQVDNRFMDTSNASGRAYAIWSGVILQRAWLQWTYSEHFALQAGYLLTPYGIWNMDHGTPTLISLVLPSLQVDEAIPQQQLGVQALGSFTQSDWELAYHAYLTNGRSLVNTDINFHKSVGGRLILRHVGALRAALGASAYYGSFEKEVLQLDLATGSFEKSELAKDGGYSGREWAVGGDVSLDYKGWRFRGEALARHVTYEDGKHEHKVFGDPSSMMPNHYRHYAYGILAYRFATYFEPYLFVDYGDADPQVSLNKMSICFSGGLNLYFTPSAMLKTQFAEQRFSHSTNGQMDMRLVTARLILVF
jgi:hypothetical protein